MAVAVKKYNPGFLTDDEIIESFCVRTGEFESIIESLRETAGNSNSHSLAIGPRGIGKTHLLLRVAAEVRRDESLAGFFPVVFPEESYEVSTCGEFWLECLAHLVEQAPAGERDSLLLTYNDLRSVQDDHDLADRCIGALLDFADRHGKRLLLIVENLNMLFSDVADPDTGWRMRMTLQTEPRIILLGSATSRFDEIDNPEHALYDLFRVITLRPLDTEECEAIWRNVSGEPITTRAVRPLEILTGGNPRLLAIIARFGAGQSFSELMGNLLDLVDEHTEYFKSHLETLPPQERRVYLALARLWKPSTTREVADLARVDTNKCSAMLGRLVQRGSVAIEGGTIRRKEYYLTERLYNIYYLLRRGVGEDRLVKALIDFMISFYSTSKYGDILRAFSDQSEARSVIYANVLEDVVKAMLIEANVLDLKGKTTVALDIYDQVLMRLSINESPQLQLQMAFTIVFKSILLSKLNRDVESLANVNYLISRLEARGESNFLMVLAMAYQVKGIVILEQGESQDALDACDRALQYVTEVTPVAKLTALRASIFCTQGLAFLAQNDIPDALTAFDKVTSLYEATTDPNISGAVATALAEKTIVLNNMNQTISDSEFLLMLNCMAEHNIAAGRAIEAIVYFAFRSEFGHVVELIQTSPAEQLLLPLLTAFRQELGQPTNVAKEVDEVAADIRRKLAEFRSRAESRALSVGGTQAVRSPEEQVSHEDR